MGPRRTEFNHTGEQVLETIAYVLSESLRNPLGKRVRSVCARARPATSSVTAFAPHGKATLKTSSPFRWCGRAQHRNPSSSTFGRQPGVSGVFCAKRWAQRRKHRCLCNQHQDPANMWSSNPGPTTNPTESRMHPTFFFFRLRLPGRTDRHETGPTSPARWVRELPSRRCCRAVVRRTEHQSRRPPSVSTVQRSEVNGFAFACRLTSTPPHELLVLIAGQLALTGSTRGPLRSRPMHGACRETDRRTARDQLPCLRSTVRMTANPVHARGSPSARNSMHLKTA